MAGLKHSAATVLSVLATLAYQLKNLVTGTKPVHVVVCGPDDSTAKTLMEQLPGLFHPTDVSVVWGRAQWAESVRSRLIVSWDPDDASRVDEIEKSLSSTRHLVYLLAVANPLELVSERCAELPHHFTQGADYRLHVEGATRSFTEPGVVSRSRDALAVVNSRAQRALTIRREALYGNTSEVIQDITNLIAQRGGPTGLAIGAAEVFTESTALQSYSDTPDGVVRVESQRRRFPELDEVAQALGYQAPPAPTSAARVSAKGLIVAFHTPDAIYEAEAERLRKSLDGLGLDYEISVVEPESNWVRTT